MSDTAVCRQRGSSHTCIRLSIGTKFTTFIPMDGLTVSKLDNKSFHLEWEDMPEYPVRRAAELYLGTCSYREMDAAAKGQLQRIMADPASAFDPNFSLNAPKEDTMATAAASKNPAAKKTAPPPAAKAAAAAPAKTAPAKKAAANGAVPAKTAPAKKNGMDTVVAQSAKAPAKTAAPTKKTGAPVATRAPNDEKLKVAAPDAPRRGVTAEFVAEAAKLKTFTRQQLLDVMTKKGHEVKAARIKIADCVYWQIFVAA